MNTVTATKKAANTTAKPTPARVVKACVRFVSAWLALRPYAPDELREAFAEAFTFLERARKTSTEKALKSFDTTLLKEFARKGKKSAPKLDRNQTEKLVDELLEAFDAFTQDVPRPVHESFVDALSGIWSDYFDARDTDRMALRRAFGLPDCADKGNQPNAPIERTYVNQKSEHFPIGARIKAVVERPAKAEFLLVDRDEGRVIIHHSKSRGGDFVFGWAVAVSK